MRAIASAAPVVAALCIATAAPTLAHGDWPDGPHKRWFESLQRPDNHLHPQRQLDHKSLYCCGAADVVKTRFRVEPADGPHPEDTWYARLNERWVKIPPEKIVKDFSPDDQAHLFVLAGTIQCFVRPKGGA